MLRRVRRSATAHVAALVAVLAGLASEASAADDDVWLPAIAWDPSRARAETSGGAEHLGSALSIYFGTTYAPFGIIREDGLRLRVSSSYGWYSYEGVARVNGRFSPYTFHAETTHSDAMLGYQASVGALTVKAFAGAAFDGHGREAPEGLSGRVVGMKGALETWLDVGSAAFASLDASWASAHEVYASRLRLGLRLLPQLSVGPEAGLYGNAISHEGRGGGFVRYEWASGEVSAAGGVAGDRNGDPKSYANINLLLRY